MPIYKYKAFNAEQQVVRGLVESNSMDAVASLLSERKLTVISVSENVVGFSFGIMMFRRVKRRSVVIFSRQMAVMIAATVPIVQALRILTAQTDDKNFKTVLSDMTNDVDGGMKLSTAFAKHPDVFNNFYIAMLRSGETSGRLEKVLGYLANQMEKDYDLRGRIRGAMVYPAFIITAMLGMGGFMMVSVIPSMTSMLKESGAELPFTTKILIGLSGFLSGYWWLIIIACIGAVVGFRAFLQTVLGRVWWDNLKLRVPIFGNLITKIILSRFATSLSTLIKGGVPISKALTITADVVSNQGFRQILLATVKEVEDGNSITTVFNQSKMVPTMLPQMMNVGERTGRMDEVLDRMGEFYTREVDTLIGSLTSLIEPMIMIILGAAVGLMVAAILMPMFQIANSIK